MRKFFLILTMLLLALSGHDGQARAQALSDTTTRPVPMYTSERVEVAAKGATLRGRLLLPAGKGPHQAAVFITGAGHGGEMPPLLEHLAEKGIAVLSLAKRGVHGSSGNWKRQSFRGRADDMIAGLEYLRSRGDIDPDGLGIVAHSQGAWIAQIIAAERRDLAYVVMLAAVSQTVRDQILTDERIHRERRGMAAPRVEREIASLRRSLRLADGAGPVCRALRAHYICYIIDFDPAPYIARVQAPVLALYAELDPEVPPEANIPLLQEGLRRAGNEDVTIRTFAAANHLFWPARTGLRDEYHQLDRRFVPGFLDTVTTWIRRRAGGAGAREASKGGTEACCAPVDEPYLEAEGSPRSSSARPCGAGSVLSPSPASER